MKIITWIFAFALFCVLAFGSPLSTDTNVKCQMDCDVQEIKHVCGADDAGETKTFTNLCIMRIENCLRTSSFQKTIDGQCP